MAGFPLHMPVFTMPMRVALLLVALTLVFAGPASAADCAAAATPADRLSCAATQQKAADTALNASYKALMGALGPDDQGRLRDAQRAWIAFRDKECQFRAGVPADPFRQTLCVAELTGRRNDQLAAAAGCKPGDPACLPRSGTTAVPAAPVAADGNTSCRQTAGPAKAQQYVAQCLEVSPATHPPCNADNACSLIIDEIKRGCGMIGQGAPAYCATYR